ncbi:hypothetical protein ZIOFF_050729 [Zingiber officinale]|uniref:Serine-threonine/tyrosine-protein kinase catalytic domain-containing protein n=1 Tax=Zingiber officinale TaxID=94328 RepID=A0A8J5FJE4_ZINOF|nr:hypothetical protein ZIOFF_050729 [Zingiber officinale]
MGWCHKFSEFILVYEFLPNQSLDWHLFPMKKNNHSLTLLGGLASTSPRHYSTFTKKWSRTFGYLASECFATDKVSKESDTFSFGVVAMEITAGRREVELSKDDEEVRLVD